LVAANAARLMPLAIHHTVQRAPTIVEDCCVHCRRFVAVSFFATRTLRLAFFATFEQQCGWLLQQPLHATL